MVIGAELEYIHLTPLVVLLITLIYLNGVHSMHSKIINRSVLTEMIAGPDRNQYLATFIRNSHSRVLVNHTNNPFVLSSEPAAHVLWWLMWLGLSCCP